MASIGKLPVTAVLAALALPGQTEYRPLNRVINHDGWSIPGLLEIVGRKPVSTEVANFDGTRVEISRFSDLPIWNKRHRHYLSSHVVFVWQRDNDSAIVLERELVTNGLRRYSVKGKPFLYLMLAYPCSVGPHGPGGCTGADVMLAYYDEDGDGKFEVEEFVNSVISPDPSKNWKPHVPAWASARPQISGPSKPGP
jgi:hypothetical protein